ncbi:hypothetical protein FRC07_005666, partial [Ceratobasidium sp. 392]
MLIDDSSLSVRDTLRGLVVDEGPGSKYVGEIFAIDEEHLVPLATVLSAAPYLEHFAWDLSYLPSSQPIVEILQTQCPNLRSIHFSIRQPDFAELYHEPYTLILKFKNLPYLSLAMTCLPYHFDEEHIESLALLVRACPNLRTIDFDFDDHHDSGGQWSPGQLCAHLKDITFHHLHTFRTMSNIDPDWLQFFDSPEKNPLHQFFLRHPDLHTIGLGWLPETVYSKPIDPTVMKALFPSVKHAEVPAFLCVPIVASKLAAQIETIKVADPYFWHSPPESDLRFIARSARCMPNLRRLSFDFDFRHSTRPDGLEELLRLAPGLQELELGIPLIELDEIVDSLKHAPNLQKLSILPAETRAIELRTGERVWVAFISSVAGVCLKLRYFRDLSDWDEVWWMVNRLEDGR